MALTNNGTAVEVASNLLPSGYTKPTVTTFTDHEGLYKSREISVTKSTVENATATTTMAAIVTAITTTASALLNADLDTTGNTVTAYSVIRAIRLNSDSVGEERFTNTAEAYICTVDVYYKTA